MDIRDAYLMCLFQYKSRQVCNLFQEPLEPPSLGFSIVLRGGLVIYPLFWVVWLAYIVFMLDYNDTSPICSVWLGCSRA